MKPKELIETILQTADVKINGNRPWDIKVLDDRFYNRVIKQGTIGLGESYMDGWWECSALDEMIFKVLKFIDISFLYRNFWATWGVLKSKILNLQTKTRGEKVARRHYNLGNDLYSSFLDPYLQYSCGYFKNTENLNKAQEQKLDLICKKLQLKSTDKVLDIGCGWGGFAKYASEHYGCHVTGITISKEQAEYAKTFTENLNVDIHLMDYRDIKEKYDKVVSVGMFEHVGFKNYRNFFKIVSNNMNENGIFLLHTIGRNKSITITDPWFEKYIFPNSMTPSQKQIAESYEKIFVMEDWHNFGQYYDKTLLSWWKNLDASWHKLKDKYGERFYKMFRFYLLSSAGSFRARNIQLWQIVLSPHGLVGGYKSIR